MVSCKRNGYKMPIVMDELYSTGQLHSDLYNTCICIPLSVSVFCYITTCILLYYMQCYNIKHLQATAHTWFAVHVEMMDIPASARSVHTVSIHCQSYSYQSRHPKTVYNLYSSCVFHFLGLAVMTVIIKLFLATSVGRWICWMYQIQLVMSR